ncbi:MAG TPA: DUF92 domain-containing protein [Polyangiaceae bacterium]
MWHSRSLRRACCASRSALAFTGSLVDSLLGTTLNAGYYCTACDHPCEARVHHCGHVTRRVRGLSWMDNDVVNLAATLAGASVGGLLAW